MLLVRVNCCTFMSCMLIPSSVCTYCFTSATLWLESTLPINILLVAFGTLLIFVVVPVRAAVAPGGVSCCAVVARVVRGAGVGDGRGAGFGVTPET